MADLLDYAKLHLEASKAAVQARVDLMKAYSDYDFRMMQVAELQVKVETDQVKLAKLRDAIRDYKLARRKADQACRRIEKDLERVDRSSRRMASLLLGETLSADGVVSAWTGLEYFIKTANSDTLIDIGKVKAPKKALPGIHFSKNRYPDVTCEDTPASIMYAWPLLQWARKKLYVPRIGTPPYELLGKVISCLADSAVKVRDHLEAALSDAKDELADIRTAGWKDIDVAVQDPKKPGDEDKS